MLKKIILLSTLFISFAAHADEVHCVAIEDRQLPSPAEFKVTEWKFTPDSDGDVSELFGSPLFPGYSFQVSFSKDMEYLAVKIHYSQAPLYRTVGSSNDTSKNTGLAKVTVSETVAASPQSVQQRHSIDFACGEDRTTVTNWRNAVITDLKNIKSSPK